ncbi:hypothetical protein [Dactylosporangium sp. NPDC005555]|uniref:hypothetical protein n=1 Tax=Dactylosporangium sp. NPDC005555 TaxID=3154889 RepID=UPI0033ADE6B7
MTRRPKAPSSARLQGMLVTAAEVLIIDAGPVGLGVAGVARIVVTGADIAALLAAPLSPVHLDGAAALFACRGWTGPPRAEVPEALRSQLAARCEADVSAVIGGTR